MIDLKDQTAVETLARALQAGDAEAIHEFYDTYTPAFRRLFLRKGWLPDDAEDLAMEVVEKIAFQPLRMEIRSGASFTGWVFKVAHNHALSSLRRKRGGELSLAAEIPVRPLDEVDDRLVTELSSTIVQDAMARLSPDERQILALRNCEDADSFREIAQQLEISAATARKRHSRARERLIEELRSDPRARELAGEIRSRN